MAVVTFDTLAFTQKLEAHGFTNEQAVAMVELQKETIATAIDTSLATKSDIHSLVTAIQESRMEVKADITRLDKEISRLRGEFILVKWVSFTTFALVALPYIRAALGV